MQGETHAKMALDEIVVCYGGLRVVQRGALHASGRPSLRVTDTAPVRPPDFAPVEALSRQNIVWRRHWLEARRLIIEFVDLALVEVDEETGTVTFDRPLAAEMEQHLVFDHVLPLVLARRGNLVLHGGVVSRNHVGAVLIGGSGAGKSTLTAFAWQRGWTVGGDDGAVLFGTAPPMAEPTYATVRLTPASADLLGLGGETSSPVVGKMRIAGDNDRAFRQEAVELRVIAAVEPVGADQPAEFHPLAGIDAHARLFASTFHAELGKGLLPQVVNGLAYIVESTTVGRLAVPRGVEGLAAAEGLLRAHLDEDRAAAVSHTREASPVSGSQVS